MEELIAKRYVTALTSVSKDVKNVAESLNMLADIIGRKEVKDSLTSPIVDANKKTDMILATLGDKADNVLVNFIKF
jgi:F-type H+-transporting ATPase subunit delta